MKRVFLIIFTLLGVGFLVWSFTSDAEKTISFSFENTVEKTAGDIIDGATTLLETSKVAVERTVFAPPPLRNTFIKQGGELSAQGILEWTNRQRENAGLPALIFSDTLSTVAEMKVRDMFANQYFEHVSPNGSGPSDLVDDVGYAYLAVGENLALGTYDGDQDLVRAWMDSRGHRENILATQFSEIGIAVGRGKYEGQMTWLAVQTFARPASDCTTPDANLSAQITANKSKLEATKREADMRLSDIEATPEPKTPEASRAYNKKVAQYNEKVKLVNDLIAIIQGQVAVYNGQVRVFNACVDN